MILLKHYKIYLIFVTGILITIIFEEFIQSYLNKSSRRPGQNSVVSFIYVIESKMKYILYLLFRITLYILINSTYYIGYFIRSYPFISFVILGFFILRFLERVFIKIKKIKKSDENEIKECTICLEMIIIEKNKQNLLPYEEFCKRKLEQNNYIVYLVCKHEFHGLCINQWEEASRRNSESFFNCPECRMSNNTNLAGQSSSNRPHEISEGRNYHNFNLSNSGESIEQRSRVVQPLINERAPLRVNRQPSDLISEDRELIYRLQIEELEAMTRILRNDMLSLRRHEGNRNDGINNYQNYENY
jgi:hypothetical protein